MNRTEVIINLSIPSIATAEVTENRAPHLACSLWSQKSEKKQKKVLEITNTQAKAKMSPESIY
uniref:Uncharacterized protein n=1 Tax=Rhizophagus irregularis (strain DAOM 181602 / DAOM 197198 / MUCL 43194) TaxID=747089 RepID=U9TAP6_RHIID